MKAWARWSLGRSMGVSGAAQLASKPYTSHPKADQENPKANQLPSEQLAGQPRPSVAGGPVLKGLS